MVSVQVCIACTADMCQNRTHRICGRACKLVWVMLRLLLPMAPAWAVTLAVAAGATNISRAELWASNVHGVHCNCEDDELVLCDDVHIGVGLVSLVQPVATYHSRGRGIRY